ncbi:MAG TPA: hypothetical protein VG055_01965 [Planctomycetaceae bacterium]|nr:hypothetical protein [Planctomycetaceae bacterium]
MRNASYIAIVCGVLLAVSGCGKTKLAAPNTPIGLSPDRRRRSITMYYYTNGRPAEEVNESHETRSSSARAKGRRVASPQHS